MLTKSTMAPSAAASMALFILAVASKPAAVHGSSSERRTVVHVDGWPESKLYAHAIINKEVV